MGSTHEPGPFEGRAAVGATRRLDRGGPDEDRAERGVELLEACRPEDAPGVGMRVMRDTRSARELATELWRRFDAGRFRDVLPLVSEDFDESAIISRTAPALSATNSASYTKPSSSIEHRLTTRPPSAATRCSASRRHRSRSSPLRVGQTSNSGRTSAAPSPARRSANSARAAADGRSSGPRPRNSSSISNSCRHGAYPSSGRSPC